MNKFALILITSFTISTCHPVGKYVDYDSDDGCLLTLANDVGTILKSEFFNLFATPQGECYISSLATDSLVYEVFPYLESKDIVALGSTNKYFREIVTNYLKDTLTEKQKIHLNKHLENAIKNNDIIGRYFVKIGGQIDTANLSLQDPVFFDPVFFNRKNTVEILIDLGVKVNINDLCIAAYMGRTEIASLLLEAVRKDGCDVVAFINSRGILFPESESSSFHSTPELPLSEAASNGKDSVVKLLLDNDADSNLSSYDNYGSASLSSAIRRMKYTINEIEDTKNERPSSLRLWCDNDARNRYNEKCADMKKNMKKMKGYNETVKLLLEASNDKIRTKHGKEAIELLAGYQRDKSKYDQRTTCSKLKQLLT